MKKTIKMALLAVLSASFAYGAQYSVGGSNFSDLVSDIVITDNAGVPIASGSGFAAVGSFSSDPRGLALPELASAFNSLGSNNMDASALIGAALPGFYSVSATPDSADANAVAAAGQNVYLFFANANDPSAATEFGVVQVTGAVFESAFAGPGPFSINAPLAGGEAVQGSFGSGVAYAEANGASSAGSFALVAIPEPSAVLLGGLALLGGLVRRRR